MNGFRSSIAILAILMYGGAAPTAAQFTNIGSVELASMRAGYAAWGDHDGDGDLDVLVSGQLRDAPHTLLTKIFRNNGEPFPTFTDIGAELGVGPVVWGDEDRDGDLDVLVTGGYYLNTFPPPLPRLRTYRSSGGPTPTYVSASVIGGTGGRGAFGDFDGDGDLDLVSPVDDLPIGPAVLYRNLGGAPPVWQDAGAGLQPAVGGADASFRDYDLDGDLDLFLTGTEGGMTPPLAHIYRNQEGVLVETGTSIVPVFRAHSAWGDCDNDGDPDLLVLGINDPLGTVTRLYKNTGGPDPDLVNSGVSLMNIHTGSAAWGDFDNDGDRDILLSGLAHAGPSRAALYRNAGGPGPTFTSTGVHFDSIAGIASWGDYDDDGDLDVLIAGGGNSFGYTTRVYRNDYDYPANTPPSIPANLVATPGTLGLMTFSWDASSDDTTPSAGLTYHLRVGTTPGGSEILAPAADPASGKLRVPADGNCGSLRTWTMRIPLGTYYWSVQAVDAGFMGSPFAPEQAVIQTTAVDETGNAGFGLGPAFPNPVVREAVISFALGQPARVRMEIFDTSGRRVTTLTEGEFGAGRHEVRWEAVTRTGRPLPAGVYVVRLVAGTLHESRRLVVSR